jgi:hypothetical protein
MWQLISHTVDAHIKLRAKLYRHVQRRSFVAPPPPRPNPQVETLLRWASARCALVATIADEWAVRAFSSILIRAS